MNRFQRFLLRRKNKKAGRNAPHPPGASVIMISSSGKILDETMSILVSKHGYVTISDTIILENGDHSIVVKKKKLGDDQ